MILKSTGETGCESITKDRDSEVRMPRQCAVCSKTNPAEAHYCYYDGSSLSNERQQGPMPMGTLPFPMPFYFANGQACANFNQLALVCDERWEEARRLLAEGYWPTFFGCNGRLDLVEVAKQAAKEPDLDVGLSHLLEKLPVDPDALRPPKLAVQDTEINLGPLTPGTDQKFALGIINQGRLVLRGMISLDCDWLVFDDRSGATLKMFQTRSVCDMPMRVLGSKLRGSEAVGRGNSRRHEWGHHHGTGARKCPDLPLSTRNVCQ